MKKRGFTLVELMVVIATISLLSSIVFAALQDARVKGRDTARIREISELQNALELFRSDYGKYPYKSPSTNEEWRNELLGSATAIINTKRTVYISKISPEVKYWSTIPPGGASSCANSTANCIGYKMGILLEGLHPILKSSRDSDLNVNITLNSGFEYQVDGTSRNPGCTADTTAVSNSSDIAEADRCYDVKYGY